MHHICFYPTKDRGMFCIKMQKESYESEHKGARRMIVHNHYFFSIYAMNVNQKCMLNTIIQISLLDVLFY